MTSEPIGSIWCEVCSAFVRDSSHLLKQPHEIAILDDLNLTPPAQKPDDALRVAALEAALSDLVQAIEGEHRDGVPVTRSIRLNAMFRAAKAALDGAPYEPSEDQVARAAIALMSDAIRASISSPWDAVDAARAALRAAFGSAADS